MPMDKPTDLEIVQMRGQCNRIRLGLHPDDKYIWELCYEHGLLDQYGHRFYLTEKGEKFCFDLSGNLP